MQVNTKYINSIKGRLHSQKKGPPPPPPPCGILMCLPASNDSINKGNGQRSTDKGHNNRDLNRLRKLSPGMRVNMKYMFINSTAVFFVDSDLYWGIGRGGEESL